MAEQQMFCRHCGSTNVARDAEARWDFDNQEWSLSATLDQAYCDACGETTLVALDMPLEVPHG